MILIGLGNKARQGKNFVANYMREAFPSLQEYAFANELKKYCLENHDKLVDEFYRVNSMHPMKNLLYWKDDPIYGCTTILQWYGTYKRQENPDFWIKLVAEKLNREKPDVAVITDVRFPNEADFVKFENGFLVQVIRFKEDGTQFLDPGRDPNHISETALDDYMGWDYIIRVKDGDLDALKHKSLGVLSNILDDEYRRRAALNSVPDATGYSEIDSA